MPSVYRVVLLPDYPEPQGAIGLINLVAGVRTVSPSYLEDMFNQMSAEGWELVSTYERFGIFRHDGQTPPPAARPAGSAWSTATVGTDEVLDEQEPPASFDPDLDLRDEAFVPEFSPPSEMRGDAVRVPVLEGDLIKLALAGRFDVIVHGCNCRHTMGGGIARQIKLAFPEAEDADLATEYAAREKLGTLSAATVVRGGRQFFVVNAYTQFEPGADANYDAIRSCFQEIKRRFAGMRIGYPRIGAGIGGGDWSVISPIIDEELAGEDHALVEYAP